MRECMERDGSAKNGSMTSCKREAYPYLYGTVPYRTVPKHSFKLSLKLFCMLSATWSLFSQIFQLGSSKWFDSLLTEKYIQLVCVKESGTEC